MVIVVVMVAACFLIGHLSCIMLRDQVAAPDNGVEITNYLQLLVPGIQFLRWAW